MASQAVDDLSAAQSRRLLLVLGWTRSEWAQMAEDWDASWGVVGPRVQVLTAAAQLGAARDGAASVPAALAGRGVYVDVLGEVVPGAFAGVASDGRRLDSLLYGAVTTAKTQASLGAPPDRALAAGGRWLDMAVHTMVEDAARGGAGVAIAARPRVGWVRMVNTPCCARCAVLAGKWFRFNEGFKRHPRCGCKHVAATQGDSDGLTEDPPLSQITGLSAKERQAVEDGADLSQVVNARRGRRSGIRSGMTTTEGTTRRGVAGRRLKGGQRLTPDAIYRLATTREETLTLLRRHGYLL